MVVLQNIAIFADSLPSESPEIPANPLKSRGVFFDFDQTWGAVKVLCV